MSKTIGILRGKQTKHNTEILQTLWTDQPLTAWELTGKIRSHGKVSLHATLNKRLRNLEKKGYVLKRGKKWILNFKGMIAYLIIEQKPKPLSSKFVNLTTAKGQPISPYAKDVQTMIRLAALANDLMEKGVINFDVIKNKALMLLLIAQDNEDAIDQILEPQSGN